MSDFLQFGESQTEQKNHAGLKLPFKDEHTSQLQTNQNN